MTISRPSATNAGADAPRTSRRAPAGLLAHALRAWPGAAALALGCVAAAVILAVAAGSEFPLFSEASAERGRDCTAIRSARHALDAALDAQVAALGAHPAEAGSGIDEAVASFRAATNDIATDAVARALGPVEHSLDRLEAAVDGRAFAGDPRAALPRATNAVAELRASWDGPLARVCQ